MMDRKRKWIIGISVALTAIFCAFGAGCGASQDGGKLSAPKNVRIEKRVLYWDEVPNADYYVVSASNGKKYETTEREFALTEFKKTGEYEFKVFAKSEEEKYEVSTFTSIKTKLYAPKAQGQDKQGYQYTWIEELNGYEIGKGMAPLLETIVIPDYFEDYPVKKIARFGFSPYIMGRPAPSMWGGAYNAPDCNTETTKIQFPKHVEIIGIGAFSYTTNIEEITIPSTVTHIEQSAFKDCAKLKKINFSSGLKEIGWGAFENTGLETLELPDTLEVIATEAFQCKKSKHGQLLSSNLSRVVIPASVKVIGMKAFDNRKKLTEILFEDLSNVEDIWKNSLPEWWYENNGEVIDGVYYIGKVLMETREDFQTKEFTVPSHVKLIRSFDGRGAVEKLYIPDGVALGAGLTLIGCENVKEIHFPTDTTERVSVHMKNMLSLEKMTIPPKLRLAGVKNPESTNYCEKLTTVVCQGVEYTYSEKAPTKLGNYWYINEEGYFDAWN